MFNPWLLPCQDHHSKGWAVSIYTMACCRLKFHFRKPNPKLEHVLETHYKRCARFQRRPNLFTASPHQNEGSILSSISSFISKVSLHFLSANRSPTATSTCSLHSCVGTKTSQLRSKHMGKTGQEHTNHPTEPNPNQ